MRINRIYFLFLLIFIYKYSYSQIDERWEFIALRDNTDTIRIDNKTIEINEDKIIAWVRIFSPKSILQFQININCKLKNYKYLNESSSLRSEEGLIFKETAFNNTYFSKGDHEILPETLPERIFLKYKGK